MLKPRKPRKQALVSYALRQAYVMRGLFAVALVLTSLFFSFIHHTSAATTSTLNFQARLESNTGAIVPDGYYNIEFKLYNVSSAGTALWTEDYYDSNGVTAGNDNRVQVINGYVSVNLGSQTAFPTTINWDQDLYLTMNIGGTTQTATPTYDGEMNPRLKLTAVPYAFRAGQLAQYNATTGFTSTLSLTQPTGGNQTFQIPDQGAAGTYNLLTQNTANANYIQNQNAAAQATSNFWISGTGKLDTGLQAFAFGTGSYALTVQANSGRGTSSNVVVAGSDAGANRAAFYVAGALAGNSFEAGGTSSWSTKITTSASNVGLAVQGATGQTADLLDLYDGSGALLSGYDASGNMFANGSLSLGTATSAGLLNLKDGAGFVTTLKSATQTGSYTLTLPAVAGNDTVCLQTLANCSNATGYIQNQNTAAQTTANFWISGTGRADTSLQVGSATTGMRLTSSSLSFGDGTGWTFDIKGGGASLISLVDTGQITLKHDTTINGTNSGLTVTTGTTATGAVITAKSGTSATGDLLQMQNASAGVLARFNSNGDLSIGGTAAANSTTAFLVQNASGVALLTADTTNSAVTIGKVSTLKGKLVIADGPTSNFVASLTTNVLTADRNITLPDESGTVCLALSANCGFLTGSAASGTYVQLQSATPGTAQTGNFNISGTGIAATLQSSNLQVTTQATVQNVADSSSELRVLNLAGKYLLNVNSSNGYVINNGTKNIGNEIQNSGFESGGNVTSGEEGWSGPAQATIVNDNTNAHSGNYELQITPNGTAINTMTAQYLSVNVGDVIYAEGWVKNSATANGTGGLLLQSYDKDKVAVSTVSDAATLPGTSYVLRRVTYTVPSGVKYVRVGVTVDATATTGTFYFDDLSVNGSESSPAVFKNTVDSTTAFTIQSAGGAQTLFTADTTNNVLKVGDSTGSDTATTLLVLDSATVDPSTNLASKNGGLFYRSDTNSLKAVIGGAVVDICTTAVTCSGYSASASSSIQLQASSPGTQQTGNFNISGTGILSQLQSSDTSLASTNSPDLTIRTGNATGTTSNSGSLWLDVGTATGTLGGIHIGHSGVTTTMPGNLDIQGSNTLSLGASGTADGSILFRNSIGANTVTLKAAAANPASSIVLTLPTALGSAGYCLKDTGGGALGFSDCGVGATVTLQNVYDNSSPANILLSNAKDFTITAQATGTSPNILMNLLCTTSCGTNGRFAVQNSGTDVLTVLPNGGGIVLGAATQIGSATTDTTQVNLQLDSFSNYADTGSCSTGSYSGAMYYNTASQSIRTCQDGSWSDVITTRDLGLLLFGVVPDSGVSNQGDLPALITPGASGPCKVSWADATHISIQACVAYSGGRRVNVAAVPSMAITGMTTVNNWINVCLTGPNNQPALSTAAASETSAAAGFFPTFNISAPVLCLAQIKGSTSAANNIAGIYDTRTFSTSQKIPMLASTALSLGMLADMNPSTAVPSVSGSRRMIGVVVATNGSTSSTSPNVILTTFGPSWIKATAGTAGDFVIQSATNGYVQTNTTIPNNSFNYETGITPNSYSTTCTSASTCSGSLFVNFQVR